MIAVQPHTAATVALARRLRAGGWGVEEIRLYLAKNHDIHVHHSTVYRWTNEAYAERSRRAKRIAMNRNRPRAGGRLGVDRHSAEFRVQRMVGLRDAGVPLRVIPAVMSFDFPDLDLSVDQVRYAITSGRLPAADRRAAA